MVAVGDGEQAIARIPIERPDIVLADIGMPKRSGYDVAAFVKGRPDLAHIPVLLLAGAFEPVDEARARSRCSATACSSSRSSRSRSSRACASCSTASQAPRSRPSRVFARRRSSRSRACAGAETVRVRSPAAALRERRAAAPTPESKLDDYFQAPRRGARRVLRQRARCSARQRSTPDVGRLCTTARRRRPTLDDAARLARRRGDSAGRRSAPHARRIAGRAVDRSTRSLATRTARPRRAPASPPGAMGGNVDRSTRSTRCSRSSRVSRGPAASRRRLQVARRPSGHRRAGRRGDAPRRRAPRARRGPIELVAQIVSEVAERLIREEIVRIEALQRAVRL